MNWNDQYNSTAKVDLFGTWATDFSAYEQIKTTNTTKYLSMQN